MPRTPIVARLSRALGAALVAGSATYLLFRLLEDLGERFVRPSTPGPFYDAGDPLLLAGGVALLVLLAELTRPATGRWSGALLTVHVVAWGLTAGLLGSVLADLLPAVPSWSLAATAALGAILLAFGMAWERRPVPAAGAAGQPVESDEASRKKTTAKRSRK